MPSPTAASSSSRAARAGRDPRFEGSPVVGVSRPCARSRYRHRGSGSCPFSTIGMARPRCPRRRNGREPRPRGISGSSTIVSELAERWLADLARPERVLLLHAARVGRAEQPVDQRAGGARIDHHGVPARRPFARLEAHERALERLAADAGRIGQVGDVRATGIEPSSARLSPSSRSVTSEPNQQ